MILTNSVEIGINYKNIDHFKKLGYKVKCSDRIVVPIEHLAEQSNIKIKVKCDYCGKEKTIKYQTYMLNINFGKRLYACCSKCSNKKAKETNIVKYGTECPLQNKEILDKSKKTLVDRYGAENISKSEYFHKKYKDTMNERYGVDNAFQLEEFKNKAKDTMIEKYGVEYNMQRDKMKDIYLNGENNHFYIDGRHEHYIDNWRSNKEANKIRGKVFSRDNRTCQCCKSCDEEINAHHLYSRNSRPDLIYDLNNLITLCKKCHIKFHSTYGYGNNTPKQYYEFIKNESVEAIESTSLDGSE